MKTFNTTTTGNDTRNVERVRLLLTLTGIVIAILCSVTLLRDVRSSEHMDSSRPHLLESYKMVGADFIGEVKEVISYK